MISSLSPSVSFTRKEKNPVLVSGTSFLTNKSIRRCPHLFTMLYLIWHKAEVVRHWVNNETTTIAKVLLTIIDIYLRWLNDSFCLYRRMALGVFSLNELQMDRFCDICHSVHFVKCQNWSIIDFNIEDEIKLGTFWYLMTLRKVKVRIKRPRPT